MVGYTRKIYATDVENLDTEISNNTDVSSNTTHRGTTTGNPHNVTANEIGANAIKTELLTVDGAGSNIDADKLDGQEGTYYLDYNNLINTPTPSSQLAYYPLNFPSQSITADATWRELDLSTICPDAKFIEIVIQIGASDGRAGCRKKGDTNLRYIEIKAKTNLTFTTPCDTLQKIEYYLECYYESLPNLNIAGYWK